MKISTVASDSKTAVSWVNNDGIGSLKYVQIIHDIRCHLRAMGRSLVMYNSSATNSVANLLAKNDTGGREDSLAWVDYDVVVCLLCFVFFLFRWLLWVCSLSWVCFWLFVVLVIGLFRFFLCAIEYTLQFKKKRLLW